MRERVRVFCFFAAQIVNTLCKIFNVNCLRCVTYLCCQTTPSSPGVSTTTHSTFRWPLVAVLAAFHFCNFTLPVRWPCGLIDRPGPLPPGARSSRRIMVRCELITLHFYVLRVKTVVSSRNVPEFCLRDAETLKIIDFQTPSRISSWL